MTVSSNSLPPGDFGLPVVGETVAFLSDPDFATKRFQKFGAVFKSRIFGQPTIFLKGAEANGFVLSNPQRFEATWPTSTRKLLGAGSLSTQSGHVHMGRRKLLAQAFMPRALSSYLSAMDERIATYAQRWVQEPDLTWHPQIRDLTLDIACKLLVGLENGCQTPLGEAFEGWVSGLFSLPIPLPWTKFGRAIQARKQLVTEISRIIQDRQITSAETPEESKPDALSLLLNAEDESGDRLSSDELVDQIMTLLFAGHETLTSSMALLCLQLALHPEVRDRLRAELDPLGHEPITLESLKSLGYLEKVMQEVLRLTPPVGGGFRKIIQACSFQGYTFPQGWQVFYQIAATHSSEPLYPNAGEFNPDRFETDPLSAVPKYGYLPFGGGIRECLGKEFARLEIKLFAIHMVQNYDWELLPNQDLSLVTIPTPKPKDGLKVRLKPRRAVDRNTQ